MLSFASRRTDRVAAATGALLLQLGFIAAFIHAFSTQAPPRQLQRELTFLLPRLLPKPARVLPAPRAPSAPSMPLNLPMLLPPLSSLRPAPPITNAPPAGLSNFGRALFGCAPETYTSLTPQQRALCPPHGQGKAIQSAHDLMRPPPSAKDEGHWAEELRRKNGPVSLLGIGGAYPPDTPMTSDEAREHNLETWDPCPQISNAPCLHNIVHGDPQPGAAGAPSLQGVDVHPPVGWP